MRQPTQILIVTMERPAPIRSAWVYSAELTKVNDQRVANIEEYARNYTQMTDQKADELVQKAIQFRKTRFDLWQSVTTASSSPSAR